MTQTWQPCAVATLIGSMPHRDPQQAVDLINRDLNDIPVWPQLPAHEDERMMVQYLEGLPGRQKDGDHSIIATDTAEFDAELLAFYQECMDVETGSLDIKDSRFQMGELTGRTFRVFVQSLAQTPQAGRAVKGQVVGPFTLLTGLTDAHRKLLLYDERMCEAVARHLALKARWQIEQLQSLGQPVIIFLDEPALAGYGSSSYIGVSDELVGSLIKEVITAIHQAGALAGIHVCANTDWSLVLKSAADIVNFDAYGYLDRFLLYRNDIVTFLQSGRIIAWGLVPTADPQAIINETPPGLAQRWNDQVQTFANQELTISTILTQSIFTPSCGCGSLSVELAERVVTMTRDLSILMRKQLADAIKR